ncbi:chaperone DnaJ-domain superfamily protein [Tasmannia lanceolata]|uniref:chaperone DnaJ-domain superfamily protein n=1 Tax=Tasmannia lanceolata TaxID=3420 RepID=UPI004064748B
MQAYLVSPSSKDGVGLFPNSTKASIFLGQWAFFYERNRRSSTRSGPLAAIKSEQDHYAVLGLSSCASSADIKRAYRLLARKYHPDVNKDLQAGQVFKSIRLAYEVLSDETTRSQYDCALRFPDDTSRPWRRNWAQGSEFDEGMRIYRWAELRQRMKHEKQKQQYYTTEENYSSYGESEMHDETLTDEREPFSEVLKFSFFTLFFMQTLGSRLSLTLCGLTALLDKQLDAGYKLGYLVAWVLGGQGGILLTLCLSFASWLCGKTSSSLVALVVVAMWVGANLARFAPLPPGALLTLLYMSIKLQVDLS